MQDENKDSSWCGGGGMGSDGETLQNFDEASREEKKRKRVNVVCFWRWID